MRKWPRVSRSMLCHFIFLLWNPLIVFSRLITHGFLISSLAPIIIAQSEIFEKKETRITRNKTEKIKRLSISHSHNTSRPFNSNYIFIGVVLLRCVAHRIMWIRQKWGEVRLKITQIPNINQNTQRHQSIESNLPCQDGAKGGVEVEWTTRTATIKTQSQDKTKSNLNFS